MSTEYTKRASVAGEFDEVVDSTVDALEDEGFGVLCDIDVRATFEKKLGEEFRQYRILGACSPSLAHEGLNEEIEIGALLPCNFIVYETNDGEVVVSAVDPQMLVGITENPALDHIAEEVHERFDRVISVVSEEYGPAR